MKLIIVIKFHKNHCDRSRIIACKIMHGRANGQTGSTKLIFAFRNFANAHKNHNTFTIVFAVFIFSTHLMRTNTSDIRVGVRS